MLLTLLAANAPHKAKDIALLDPLIVDTLLLLHFGQYTLVSIGIPQFGQFFALFDTSFPHSGHLIIAILFPPNPILTCILVKL